jgi:hypothetical protein
MFNKPGDHKVKITETCLAEPKFETAGPNGFDVCLHVQSLDDPNQCDWWRGEVSPNYGKGNFSDRTQAQITLGTLEKVGFKGGNDLSRLDELVGVETLAHVEASADGKYHNIKWIGAGGNAPRAIDMGTAAARFKALMGAPGGGQRSDVGGPRSEGKAVNSGAMPAKAAKVIPNPFA